MKRKCFICCDLDDNSHFKYNDLRTTLFSKIVFISDEFFWLDEYEKVVLLQVGVCDSK